jgi:hypothetical protein
VELFTRRMMASLDAEVAAGIDDLCLARDQADADRDRAEALRLDGVIAGILAVARQRGLAIRYDPARGYHVAHRLDDVS